MSDKIFMKDITLPIVETGENETYSFVQTDADLDTAGDAADAKAVGDELTNLKQELEGLDVYTLGLYPQMSVADTAVASFTDGADDIPVKSLTVDVTPVQDLHGQSSPYPAGGGKNYLPMTVTGVKALNTGASWSGNAYTLNGVTFTIQTDAGGNVTGIQVNGTPSANTTFIVAHYTGENLGFILNGCPSNGSDSTYRLTANSGGNDYGSGVNIGSGWNGYVSIYVYAQVSNIIFKPMIRLSSVSDATFAPYSNICPISGWTGANVSVAGKNMYNPDESENGKWLNTETGVAQTVSGYWVSGYIPVVTGENYTKTLAGSSRACYYNASKGFVSSVQWNGGTQTIPSGVSYVRFTGETTIIPYDGQYQFEHGSTATAYEPYNGNTYSITFPTSAGTVYGGTLDVTNGVLTVTNGYVGLGALNWSRVSHVFNGSNASAGFTATLPNDCKRVNAANKTPNAICSRYKGVTVNTMYNDESDGVFSYYDAYTFIGITDSAYTDASSFKTGVTGQTLVYELAEPVTYQLDPTEVATILGQNNIFADTGDIAELTYRADLKAYIDAHVGS